MKSEKAIVNIINLSEDKDLELPRHATEDSAGVDLVSNVDVVLHKMERKLISTGIAIELPKGFEAQVRPRSGLAFKHGITLINSPGTIDADYRGEILVPLINLGDKAFEISRGLRIAQMIVSRYYKVEFNLVKEFDASTRRGEGGFGSTGLKS